MKIVYATTGEAYKVDDNMFDMINQYSWNRTYMGAAQAYIDSDRIYMHHLVLPRKDNLIVDHIDGDRTNNQRSNLRLATYSQNSANRKKTHGTSIYKGVSWYEKQDKWVMKWYEGGRQLHGGYFDCEHDAAKAYNREMFRVHGEFAKLNVIERTVTEKETDDEISDT
jgi:hypothetical protein